MPLHQQKDESPRPAGYEALLQKYGLEAVPHWHRSFVDVGSAHRVETASGSTEETYPSKYWPGDGLGLSQQPELQRRKRGLAAGESIVS